MESPKRTDRTHWRGVHRFHMKILNQMEAMWLLGEASDAHNVCKDGNLEDHSIEWCLKMAESPIARRVLRHFLALELEEREAIYEWFWEKRWPRVHECIMFKLENADESEAGTP